MSQNMWVTRQRNCNKILYSFFSFRLNQVWISEKTSFLYKNERVLKIQGHLKSTWVIWVHNYLTISESFPSSFNILSKSFPWPFSKSAHFCLNSWICSSWNDGWPASASTDVVILFPVFFNVGTGSFGSESRKWYVPSFEFWKCFVESNFALFNAATVVDSSL